jgi:hypothetical protein
VTDSSATSSYALLYKATDSRLVMPTNPAEENFTPRTESIGARSDGEPISPEMVVQERAGMFKHRQSAKARWVK